MDNLLDSKKAKQVSAAFSLVLNDNGADLFKNSRTIMSKILKNHVYQVNYVAVGYHDSDINEFGDKKTPHYHVVIEFDGKMQLKTCVNWLVDLFNCNINQISIEKCNDIGGQTRYILHMDDIDKFHYKESILVCNSFERCQFYLDHIRIRDEKHLIEIIDDHPSRRDLLRILGKKQYKEWRFAIQDLLR